MSRYDYVFGSICECVCAGLVDNVKLKGKLCKTGKTGRGTARLRSWIMRSQITSLSTSE